MKVNGHIILFMTDLHSAPFVHSLLIGISPEGGAMQGPAPGHGCCPLCFREWGVDDAGERLHLGPGGDELGPLPVRFFVFWQKILDLFGTGGAGLGGYL